MVKILITGGNGFIGFRLYRSLINNYKVTIWDTNTTTPVDITTVPVKKYDFDYIIHCAAIKNIRDCITRPHLTNQTNVAGTANILEIAKLSNSQVIFFSSSNAAHPDSNVYGLSKFIGEKMCQMYHSYYGVPIIIFRPFNVYGGRDDKGVVGIFGRATKAKELLKINGDGSHCYDYIHVSDVVSAVSRSIYASKKCQIVELGTGINYTVLQVANMFQPNQERIWLPKVVGELQQTRADISLANELLSWHPKIMLPDYIKGFLTKLE